MTPNPKIKVGMKFIHATKKRWPYQVSEIDEDVIVVSWIVKGLIYSTLYERYEVDNYFKKGTWELADPKTKIVHPS